LSTTHVFDLEIFQDYFLAAFKNINTNEVQTFEMFEGQSLDKVGLRKALKSLLISFNGNSFDVPLLSLALSGADTVALKNCADSIIVNNTRGFQLENEFKFKTLKKLNHIDLIEIAPGMMSLKMYGGRLHCETLQDLPFEPTHSVQPGEREILRSYCINDLALTQALYMHLLPQIDLRIEMGNKYDFDLRSKSDAQIAEMVICQEVSKISGVPVKKPNFTTGTNFFYRAPDFITFETVELKFLLNSLQADPFVVLDSGKLNEPEWLKNLSLKLGDSTYTLGVGGLHSTEESTAHLADDDTILVDRDVTSYYPNIILSCDLAPAHLGKAFLKVYKSIVEQRIDAKRSGDKVTDAALKVVINGSFGKFGSKYSGLYSPDLLIQTTITGQLALLMLIEQLEAQSIAVVSANTDGIVIKCPRSKSELMQNIVYGWEVITGFETDETEYKALYSRDVNNYIALTPKGFKAKGAFALNIGGLFKNPTSEISTQAVIKYLQDGTPVETTIQDCTDICRFLSLRSVKGGALDQNKKYLGKAIRWYYSTQINDPITYKINGYVVPRTAGARAMMTLPGAFPSDVNFEWYIKESNDILKSIGATYEIPKTVCELSQTRLDLEEFF